MALERGEDPFAAPLWSSATIGVASLLAATRAVWQADSAYAFWLRWYDAAMAGKPLDWDMQREIVLIPKEDWKAGPEQVAERIAEIEARYKPAFRSELDAAILRLALTDFTFNDLRTFLRMVPFEADLAMLRDPARVARFAEDSRDLRDAIGDFADMAAAGANQYGREIAALLARLAEEIENADNIATLRVGRLIDLGVMLQNMSLDENTRGSLSTLLVGSLDTVVERLLKLSRDYFPLALDRLQPLREVRLLPEDDPAAILRKLRGNLDQIRKVQGGEAVPLERSDVAILADVLGSGLVLAS